MILPPKVEVLETFNVWVVVIPETFKLLAVNWVVVVIPRVLIPDEMIFARDEFVLVNVVTIPAL